MRKMDYLTRLLITITIIKITIATVRSNDKNVFVVAADIKLPYS